MNLLLKNKRMEQSNIMQNANFLRVLRQANRSRQRTMIPSASDRQILALCDVVAHLLQGHVPILPRDRSHFRRWRLVMRQLISPRISIARKKETLSHCELIPRLLRDYYLARILIRILRDRES